jgi:hypothetical protein
VNVTRHNFSSDFLAQNSLYNLPLMAWRNTCTFDDDPPPSWPPRKIW